MIVDPRNRAFAAGAQSESPVERVDIFASLCDLADVAAPADIDGTSLRPMLLDASNRVKSVATSQFPRWYEGRQLIGNACRNERFCYIEWEDSNFEKEDRRGEIIDIELYDYHRDPDETRNLANDPEYAEVLMDMQAKALRYKRAHRPAWQ